MKDDVKDILGEVENQNQGTQGESNQQGAEPAGEDMESLKSKLNEYESAIYELKGLVANDEVLRNRLQEIYNGKADVQKKGEDEPSDEEPQEIEPEKEVVHLKDKVEKMDEKMSIMERKNQLEELARTDKDFFEDEDCLKTMEQIVLENPQFEDMPNGAKLAYELAKSRMGDELSAKRQVAGEKKFAAKAAGVSIVNDAQSGRPKPPVTKSESLRRQFAQMIKESNSSTL